jgi:hypothetical protein
MSGKVLLISFLFNPEKILLLALLLVWFLFFKNPGKILLVALLLVDLSVIIAPAPEYLPPPTVSAPPMV